MCLKQENILGSQISQENYEIIIQQLVIWVFEVDNVKSLVKVEEKTYFDVIMLFFLSPALEIINKFSDNIKIKCPSTLNEQEADLIRIFLYLIKD